MRSTVFLTSAAAFSLVTSSVQALELNWELYGYMTGYDTGQTFEQSQSPTGFNRTFNSAYGSTHLEAVAQPNGLTFEMTSELYQTGAPRGPFIEINNGFTTGSGLAEAWELNLVGTGDATTIVALRGMSGPMLADHYFDDGDSSEVAPKFSFTLQPNQFYLITLKIYGSPGSLSGNLQAVPEPTTSAFMAMGGYVLLCRRRKA